MLSQRSASGRLKGGMGSGQTGPFGFMQCHPVSSNTASVRGCRRTPARSRSGTVHNASAAIMAHQINLKLQFNFGRIRALFRSVSLGCGAGQRSSAEAGGDQHQDR